MTERRTACCTALVTTECIVIGAESYKDAVGREAVREIQAIVKSIQNLDIFEGWYYYDITGLAKHTTTSQYTKGVNIFEKVNFQKCIFIVIEGEVEV